MDFSWISVTVTCYFYYFVVERLGSLSVCCQCIKQPGLALKVVLLWAGGWTGWPPGVPPSLLEGVFFVALSVFTETLSSDVLTYECDHPSVLPLCLSAENHLFFSSMPLFCLSRLSPGDRGSWQSEPQWLIWSSSILLMAPAVTSEGRVPFLGKALSSMALQRYLHTQ